MWLRLCILHLVIPVVLGSFSTRNTSIAPQVPGSAALNLHTLTSFKAVFPTRSAFSLRSRHATPARDPIWFAHCFSVFNFSIQQRHVVAGTPVGVPEIAYRDVDSSEAPSFPLKLMRLDSCPKSSVRPPNGDLEEAWASLNSSCSPRDSPKPHILYIPGYFL